LDETFDSINSTFSFSISALHENQRLDMTVADIYPQISRSSAARLIREGLIRVGGECKKPSYRGHAGEVVTGLIPAPEPYHCTPEPIAINILYEDEHLTILNKPAGLVVHPAPGNWTGTLVSGLLYRSPELSDDSGSLRPGIIHRLDKDTSGVLITTRSQMAKANLSEQFKNRSISKTYLALVQGQMADSAGVIDLPIGRHPVDRKRMAVNVRPSREAYTKWGLLTQFRYAALLRVSIQTGRTHQIRVHLKAIGHPVVGDIVYGKSPNHVLDAEGNQIPAPRQMLHAWEVCFLHPITLQSMTICAPVPPDMKLVLDALGPHGI
jgi:23S rRNA pseudouridine1911/1915/1917 synthase